MTQRYLRSRAPSPAALGVHLCRPASFNGEELVGRRVLVPFRNRAMVGVGLAVSQHARLKPKRIKEIAELLDPVARASAQTHRAGPLDQPLLSRAHR